MKTRNEHIEDFLSKLDTEIDVLNCVDIDNVTDFDSLYNEIDESNGFDIDIIYYSNAMEYLTQNDTSLYESMEIAQEYGFEPKDINSELLASLHASREVRNDFGNLQTEVNDFFTDLDVMLECEECEELHDTEEEAEKCCAEE